MMFQSTSDAINFISSTNFLDYNDSFALSQYCSRLLRSSQDEKHGREIVIRIRDAWDKVHINTKSIWNDLTEAAGLYPYVDASDLSPSALIRYEFHKSPFIDGVYLHEEQQLLSMELHSSKAVVVSAPTSFGKSLLIEEVVASRRYKNIVIIQPTLALLDETRKKLFKYRHDYKIIVSTNQEPDLVQSNIYLFTGERVIEYEHLQKVDFFVIDEFYKLSVERDDDRAIALNQAFNRLLRLTRKFYLLGPMIKNIPISFKQKFDLIWFPTEFATVAVDEFNFEIVGKQKAADKKRLKKERLFDYLSTVDDQTIIYCSSPSKATTLALEFAAFLSKSERHGLSQITKDRIELSDWISQSINPYWSLVEALKSQISFHHGALPRHVGSSIVDAFNAKSVRWLFCTSTLIEGVNTTAKNVILYDKEKGRKPIDFFDYKNIAGRSGRMNRHYIGNVIRFEKQPEQMELFVDIPLFDQKNAPLEILISLEGSELEHEAAPKLSEFNKLDNALKNVLRKNASVNLAGQLKIIEQIESNVQYYAPLLNWTSFPSYDQLLAVIDLAWNHLSKPGDNKADVRSPAQLAMITLKYSRLQSLSALINDTISDQYSIDRYPDRQIRIDTLTFFVLNVSRHWFDYKLPKWISVVSDLQQYALSKHGIPGGNYAFFAGSLEHSFLPPGLAALIEYGIPTSAIGKLRNLLDQDLGAEILISKCNSLSDDSLKRFGLIDYEISKIRNSY